MFRTKHGEYEKWSVDVNIEYWGLNKEPNIRHTFYAHWKLMIFQLGILKQGYIVKPNCSNFIRAILGRLLVHW